MQSLRLIAVVFGLTLTSFNIVCIQVYCIISKITLGLKISDSFILYTLLICTSFTLYICYIFFSKKDYTHYTKDNLLNTQNPWYWEWDKENIKTLHSKCSKCDELLVYDENYCNNRVFFYCPSCDNQEMIIRGGNYKYSQYIIEREIKRKAGIGKYKKVI